MEVAQGTTEIFELLVTTGGALTDLDAPPDVEILRPDLTSAATGTGTRVSTGRYRYAFSAPLDAVIGDGWSVNWTGTAAAVPVAAVEEFAVVEPTDETPGLLASVEDLETYLEDELDHERAELFLLIASGEVRAATGLAFTLTRDDEILLDGKGSVALLLPEAPVLAVSSIVEAPGRDVEKNLDGPDADSPAFEWNDDGIVRRIDRKVFARRFRYYRVTYDHGFAVIPDEVRGVVIRAAARAFENPEGVRSETIGRYSYTLAGEQAGIGLYGPDLRDLEPYMIGTKMRAGTATASSGSGS